MSTTRRMVSNMLSVGMVLSVYAAVMAVAVSVSSWFRPAAPRIACAACLRRSRNRGFVDLHYNATRFYTNTVV